MFMEIDQNTNNSNSKNEESNHLVVVDSWTSVSTSSIATPPSTANCCTSSTSPLLADLLARKQPIAAPLNNYDIDINNSLVVSSPTPPPPTWLQRSPLPALSPWSSSKDLLDTLNSSLTGSTQQPTRTTPTTRRRMLDWKLVNSSSSSASSSSSSSTQLMSTDCRSVCLHATCASCFETEGVRVDTPLRANCVTTFEWHVAAHTTAGTSVMFGVCSESTQLHCSHGYVDLLGSNDSSSSSSSWALSAKGRLHHAGQSWPYCAPFDDGREHTVTCVVNTLTGCVEFYVDGRAMGRAFSGMQQLMNTNLYACVSSTTARSIFRLGLVYETYMSLQEMCSHRVLTDPTCLWRALNEFHLPASMIYAANSSSLSS